jgi:oxalate decarboxylase
MVLMSTGRRQVCYLEAGDVYFVPGAYPHQIEVRVFASVFGVAGRGRPAVPFTPVDPLLVERVNPVDPVEH